jgi:geranylgeranyl pyrophosphate synthase
MIVATGSKAIRTACIVNKANAISAISSSITSNTSYSSVHGKINANVNVNNRRYSTTSKLNKSSPMIDFIPNSVKDAVKASILDEVARHDSNLWNNDDDAKMNSTNRISNESNDSNNSNNISNSNSNSNTRLNGNNSRINGNGNVNVNDPISSTRLTMLNDPLDEWYLDSKPGSILSNSNNSNISPSDINPPLTKENDPFIISQKDIGSLSSNIRSDLIGKDHPVLTQVAGYFFEDGKDGGKKVRPMMVLLLSRAMSISNVGNVSSNSKSNATTLTVADGDFDEQLFTSQKRLAEISEMIHTASLFHDDVIDKADTRRGSPAVHQVFGNKMAILAGDYLLARASVFLARLRNVEVVETMSTIIEHLVRGEVMQMRGKDKEDDNVDKRLVHYLRKNFYKTASLMANSCKSAAILGYYDDEIVEGAYRYGKHLGIAFQLVDDVLDFDGSAPDMGKAALADLNAGLATAPVLFAAEKFPNEIQPMMDRKFRDDGDVDLAVQFVRQSDGIQRTKDLAQVHVELAIESILKSVGPSEYRDALVHLAHKVVDRTR